MTGYYGKVSTHGDFVGRRLPAHLVQAWDAWLQEYMRASQETLGSAWLERYLNSPVWRFAIAPGVLGPEGIGGVMMPSVDRVGRYFPLMVGATGVHSPLEWVHEQSAWYDRIEDIARGSLAPTFLLDMFENLPEPAWTTKKSTPLNSLEFPLPNANKLLNNVDPSRGSSWWTDGGPFVGEQMLIAQRMPQAQEFSGFLDDSCSH